MTHAADRHLLFGLLALQNGLIDQAGLVAAFQAWARDKARPLADHLVALGYLNPAQRPAVEAIAAIHLEAHGGDPEKSLAAIPAGTSTREDLAAVGDPELEGTIAHLGPRCAEADAERTASYVIGTAKSDGQRFRVLRPHARGGLGAVHVALDTELHREVALKQILEEHADDPTSRARFLVEAEITGGLEHPGIVPVYGLGMYADGRPYYAMRFIRGDSLKKAVDRFHADEAMKADPGRRTLDLRKLLRRFVDVCNAIDYAHSRGVLHRDIKPANVVVGKHGETLVVDWGLAKALGRSEPGSDAGERTLVPSSASGSAETLDGSTLGTPSYMSPEQAAGDLEHMGPRSDVYSLGATLYYLLTGRQPVEGNVGEVLRAVREGEFPPPRRLDASIDGALEAVCLKAMAHKATDRYASAKALADDVERWMADEPVSAWREPPSRRARRWARRNRTVVATAAAAMVAGVVGLSAVLVVQTRAKADIAAALGRETRANAALAAVNAELTRSKAAVQERYELAVEAIKTFHTGVSEDFLLREEKFKALRDRLLKSAADFYGKLGALLGQGTDLASRRALAASSFELAWLTAMVGRTEDALAAHRAVLEARRSLAAAPGGGAEAIAELGRSLTEVARLLGSAGKTEESLVTYREAEALLAGPAGPSPEARSALADCRSGMGYVLSQIGKNEEALAAYRRARADQESLAGASDEARRDLADTANRIGSLLSGTGRPGEAEAEYRDALAIERKLADDHPAEPGYRSSLADSHYSLGSLLSSTGRLAEAEAEYRAALAIQRKLADENPAVAGYRDDLADSHFSLGLLLSQTGKPSEAEAEYRKALEIRCDLADDNPAVMRFRSSVADSHFSLGLLLRQTGKLSEAEVEYRAALAVRRELAEADPAVTGYRDALAASHNNLGSLLRRMGQPSGAAAEYRHALAIWQGLADANPAVPEFRNRVAVSRVGLAYLVWSTGKVSEAEAEYRKALIIHRKLAGENPALPEFRNRRALDHEDLGILLWRTGRPSEAEAEYREALAIYRGLSEGNPEVPEYRDGVAGGHTRLADLARSLGRPAEARDGYDRAIAIREALIREDPRTTVYRSHLAYSLLGRGLARRELGEPAGAAADVRRALELYDGLSSRTGEEWYESACCHAALAGVSDADASGNSSGSGPAEADRAMERLGRAVGMGCRNIFVYRTEAALGPLGDREDFRLMLMDLAMPDEAFARGE